MSELRECPCCSVSEGQQREGLRSGGVRDALRDAEGPECGPMQCPVQRSRNRLVTLIPGGGGTMSPCNRTWDWKWRRLVTSW